MFMMKTTGLDVFGFPTDVSLGLSQVSLQVK
jgi:hypothetical protein